MAQITAALVKELRERTNVGMMDCKNALVETSGDIDQAIELLRKKGIAQAQKKGARIAADGLVTALTSSDQKQAVLLEVNCETDFVAKEDSFKKFVTDVAAAALAKQVDNLEDLSKQTLADHKSVDATRLELIAQLGENISIRRVELFTQTANGCIGTYIHGGSLAARIATVVVIDKKDSDLAKDLAMHIAASNPEYKSATDIPAERIAKEKEIYTAQLKEMHTDKSDDFIANIINNKLKKFTKDITLFGQAFIKDTNISIEDLLKKHEAQVNSFARFEVGEGIEKKQTDFVAEVMAQVKGN